MRWAEGGEVNENREKGGSKNCKRDVEEEALGYVGHGSLEGAKTPTNFEITPLARLPMMNTASHANPAAPAEGAAAPKGTNNAASTSSRVPIPANVIGTNAESFARGHANSQARSGSASPHSTPTHCMSTTRLACDRTLSPKITNMNTGR